MRKMLLLMLAAVLVVGPVTSDEFRLEAEAGITGNASISFVYNSSNQRDYTLSLTDSDQEVQVSNAQMQLIESYDSLNTDDSSTNTTNSTDTNSTGTNSTDTNSTDDNTTEPSVDENSYYVYEYNYTVPENSQVGDWEAQVFNGFASINSTEFAVKPDELRIIDSEVLPNFKNSQDDIRIRTEVTELSNETMKSLKASVQNTSVQAREMFLQQSSRYSSTYIYDVGELANGSYQYEVGLQGRNTTDLQSGSFQVYPETTDADSADISASIAPLCGVQVQRFRSPGGGVISLNGSGSFKIDINNNASARANVSAELNVTYQNESQWRPEDGYDELGPQMNMSYDRLNASLLSGDAFTSVRGFNDTDELGWYTGILDVNVACPITDPANEDNIYGIQEFNVTDYTNFRVLVAGGGSGGKGNPTGDEAVPKDANQSGAESNDEVEGDSDNPGQTEVPEPEPEPVPEPVPEPEPTVNVNLESWNLSVSTDRGRYARIKLEVENIGDSSVQSLNISPETEALPGDWDVTPAQVAELGENEAVNRSVYAKPSESVEPGTYRLPIYGSTDQLVDLERVRFTVNQDVFRSSIRISESPQVVEIGTGSSNRVPLLLQNLGRGPVNSTDVSVQNLEDCGSVGSDDVGFIGVNETRSLALTVNASQDVGSCNATVVVSTDDGSYSFSNMEIEVVSEQGIVPPELRFPVFASAWTILLVAYSVIMTRYELNSLQVRLPFILLIAGEAAIFIYISGNYYSLIPAFLLPF